MFLRSRLAIVLYNVIIVVIGSTVVAQAQSVSLNLGHGGAPETAKLIQLVLMIGLMALAPSLLVMLTAFTRIIIVLSILRTALGMQTMPPNTVLIGLALFLTYFVMQPVFDQAWYAGLQPMTQGTVDTMTGIRQAAAPFHVFLAQNARSVDVRMFSAIAHMQLPDHRSDVSWRVLIPSFVVGELRRGFEMGFMIYLPFMVIDLVVSAILMSLGMMMLPPTAVSLPFKLIFFVVINGWQLICGSLVRSFPVTHF
ncbi:MAG: flagellar type III secretion system pore protein FliP [Acidiphilium sp.]|nr:flagellar type III secretion system pore protein FliP [Acidiphilium sp.]MDD4936099.1 flagellar type III secretion system pore protein FliP [Acidiphilium sp.]